MDRRGPLNASSPALRTHTGTAQMSNGVIADIRIDDLDQRHVLPNIGRVVVREYGTPSLNVR